MAQPPDVLNSTQIAQLLLGPAVPPPPGIQSDLHNVSSLRLWIYVEIPVGLTVITLALALRLFTRGYLMRSIVLEDYLTICAWITLIVQFASAVVQAGTGWNNHMWNITLAEFLRGGRYVTWSIIIYPIGVLLIKVAILLQYLRIFVPVRQMSPVLFFTCWTCIAITVIFYLVTDIVVGCQSTQSLSGLLSQDQIRAAWFSSGVFGFLGQHEQWYQASAVFNIVSDVVILLLPLPSLLRLKVDTKKKVAIMSLFAAGILACVISAVRLYYTLLLFQKIDASWYGSILVLFSWNEPALGLLIFCLPSVPQFYSYLRTNAHVRSLAEFEGAPSMSEATEIG